MDGLRVGPVASDSRFAARPVGAQSSDLAVLRRGGGTIALTIVVLPTPGPPVMTRTLAPSDWRTASRWLGRRRCRSFSRPGSAGAGRCGQGGLPRELRRRAAILLGPMQPGRKIHGVGPRVSAITACAEVLEGGRTSPPATSRSRLGGRHQLFGGRAQWPWSVASRKRMEEAGPHAGHRRRDAELRGDLVRRLEADAPDVAGEPVGVRSPSMAIVAVGLEDADGARGADAMAVEEDHDLAHRLLFVPGGLDRPAAGPMPSTLRRRRGSFSMTSKTRAPKAATSFSA